MSNQIIETIKSRRAHRAYLPTQIKQEELEAILEAGYYAPSAHNNQPWRFTVIQNPELIDELSGAIKSVVKDSANEFLRKSANDKDFHVFYKAPTIVIVSGENSAIVPLVDCAAATQNMLIAAESMNIGSCWIGFANLLFNDPSFEKYRSKLAIAKDCSPYFAFTLGYKVEKNLEPKPRKENIINFVK